MSEKRLIGYVACFFPFFSAIPACAVGGIGHCLLNLLLTFLWPASAIHAAWLISGSDL